jgi:hypothetical protein
MRFNQPPLRKAESIMAEKAKIDHTKSYPWPTTPRKDRVKYSDIRQDIMDNLAAKPARDAAARAEAARNPAPINPKAVIAQAAAEAFSKTAPAAKEIAPHA